MRFFGFYLLTLISLNNVQAQTKPASCNCDVTISKDGGYDGKLLGYKPGQTICIAAGNYTFLSFRNIVGTAKQPIKVINCGGRVNVATATSTQNGIVFWDSKFVKLTGSGDSRFKYGLQVSKTPANFSGINITGLSTDFEIEQVEVSGTGFAGIMVKQDPTCDPATWRENFSMYNIKIHDNYMHDTGSEGMYIGSSFWNNGMVRTCNGVTRTLYPHNIYGLVIYNNLTERTGAEGIQYACAPESRVYNNVVKNAGINPFDSFQNNGIQASGGVSGRLYNNVVQTAGGHGIIIVGHSGTNLIYNNLITNVGLAGIFCDNRAGTPSGNPIIFTNNTIVKTTLEGFRLYNDQDRITLTNNAVVQSANGKMLLTASNVKVAQSANYYGASISVAQKNKVFDNSYRPLAGSPLIDKGLLNTFWAINSDLDGKARMKGAGIDIGAYEFDPGVRARYGVSSDDGNDEHEAGVHSITAYPSPCTDEILLKLTDQEQTISALIVYSIDGKPIAQITPALPTNEIRLKTTDFPTGIYVFQAITAESGVLRGRFIKI